MAEQGLKYHAITADLPKNLIFDAGVLYKNFKSPSEPGEVLGATRGGSEFNLNAEIREIEADGVPGPVKGLKRVSRAEPSININLLALTMENLKMAIPGAKSSTAGEGFDDYDVITSGQITDDSYFENLALVARTGAGKPVIVIIENALADGDLSISFADNDEANPSITFAGHYDPAVLETQSDPIDNMPFKIYYPKASTTNPEPPEGGDD